MAGRFSTTLLALALCVPAASCSEADGGCPDATDFTPPNPGGKAHGEPCTSDEECLYRTCYASRMLSGGTVKVCTKDCSGGCVVKDCALDGDFHCVKSDDTLEIDEGLASFCLPACTTDADCPSGLQCLQGSGSSRKLCRKPQ